MLPALALSAMLGAADPSAPGWVDRLASRRFAERQAAEARLVASWPRSLLALDRGRRHGDPEVAERCAEVFACLREAERERFRLGCRELGGAWPAFRERAGDSDAARELFLAMTHDPARERELALAAADPAEAARLYAREAVRNQQRGDALGAMRRQGRAEDELRDMLGLVTTPADVAGVLFLGSLDRPASAREPANLCWTFGPTFVRASAGPYGVPLRTLFANWLQSAREPRAIDTALEAAAYARLREALPVARRLAADPALPPHRLEPALVVLGNLGGVGDLELLRRFRDDDRVVAAIDTRFGRSELMACDLAASMSLALRGEEIEEYGFRGFHYLTRPWWLQGGPHKRPQRPGLFRDPDARPAALARAWGWLETRPPAAVTPAP
jgi:hypothetical protein